MAEIKTLTKSFGGGEITPELFGRIDLAKFQTGLKSARNFEILPHGPAANRTGFEYVLEAKFQSSKTILLPFIYNAQQSYQLEFGDLYVRFHTNNGTVLNASQAITGATVANPAVFTLAAHGYVTGNWLFTSGFTGGWAVLNGRFLKVVFIGVNTFSLTDLAGNAISSLTFGAFAAGSVASVYEIVSPYAAADFFDANGVLQMHYVQSNDVFTITHPNYQARELRRSGPTTWAFNLITVVPTQVAPTLPVATPTLAGAITYTYVVTAIATNTLEESVASAPASCNNDLTIAGHFNTITFTNAAGAVRYQVYKKINGIFGFIGQTSDGVTGFVDNNITPNVGISPPIANDPISAVGTYPGTAGYYQGRRWFGGSNNVPQGLYATRSGTESNMGYSIPTQANDSITVRLTSRQNNTIRHILPLGDLILLTSGAEWRVSSDTKPITPANIDYTPQDYIGASNCTPVTTANSILYAQDRGGRLREMRFNWQQQGYTSSDISIMAPHLFDLYTITSMAYARAPYSFVWLTRSDGALLGLTYVSEHQVAAWHHHDTDGEFECACVTPEGPEDVLYVVVKRSINGRTVRYIERQRTRQFGSILALAFFVDSGLTYQGGNVTATTLSLSTGGGWTPSDFITITAAPGATFTADDVNNEFVMRVGAATVRINVTTFTDATHVIGLPDIDVPVALRGVATSDWDRAASIISGLWHLEGETVSILADGAVLPQEVVVNGTVTIDNAASTANIGLPYTCDFETLPLSSEQIMAAAQGMMKNLNAVWLRLNNSSGVFAGPAFNKLTEMKQRTTEPYGSPPRLVSDVYKVVLTPNWNYNGTLCIRQANPLPLTVLSLVLNPAEGG